MEQNQCQSKETQAQELCSSPYFAKYHWDWVIALPSTAAWSEKSTHFHRPVCDSLLSYFVWTQKANLFHMLDSGSDYGFSHKEFVISEMQLGK